VPPHELRTALPDLAALFVREMEAIARSGMIFIARRLMEMIASDLVEWSKPSIVDPQQPVFARRRAAA
jgi:hypothetical protein